MALKSRLRELFEPVAISMLGELKGYPILPQSSDVPLGLAIGSSSSVAKAESLAALRSPVSAVISVSGCPWTSRCISRTVLFRIDNYWRGGFRFLNLSGKRNTPCAGGRRFSKRCHIIRLARRSVAASILEACGVGSKPSPGKASWDSG